MNYHFNRNAIKSKDETHLTELLLFLKLDSVYAVPASLYTHTQHIRKVIPLRCIISIFNKYGGQLINS